MENLCVLPLNYKYVRTDLLLCTDLKLSAVKHKDCYRSVETRPYG